MTLIVAKNKTSNEVKSALKCESCHKMTRFVKGSNPVVSQFKGWTEKWVSSYTPKRKYYTGQVLAYFCTKCSKERASRTTT